MAIPWCRVPLLRGSLIDLANDLAKHGMGVKRLHVHVPELFLMLLPLPARLPARLPGWPGLAWPVRASRDELSCVVLG